MTATVLKIIALISMLIDHILKILPSQPILLNLGMNIESSYQLLEIIDSAGKIAFPIFAFFIAEGCIHTKNKKHYLLRLLIGALVSEIPYQLAFQGTLRLGVSNIMFTMLLGAAVCMAYDALCKQKNDILGIIFLLPASALAAEFLGMDYGGFGILFIVVPFIIQKKNLRCLALAGVSTVFYLGYAAEWSLSNWLSPYIYLNWGVALVAVFFLWLYDGNPGKGLKWFFYVFYPAHIFILYLLCFLFPQTT